MVEPGAGTGAASVSLPDLGFSSFFETRFQALPPRPGLVPARVSADSGELWELTGCRSTLGELSGRRRRELRPGERPTTGDWVAVTEPGDRAVIHHVLERRTTMWRRAVGSAGRAQVVAANVDVFFIVTSANRDLNPRRLERYVTAVWDSGARPVVILNKCDLVEDPTPWLTEIEIVAPGVAVAGVSAQTGRGVDALQPHLTPGTTVGFIGSSGVGKSTLINRLLGRDDRTTDAVRSDEKGRHTTTRRELVPLAGGAVLLDTPGMRELGLLADDTGLDASFPEIRAAAEQCRFRDCRHDDEPGCAVRAAIDAGIVEEDRLASYRKLQREIAAAEARRDPVRAANRKRRWKAIHKEMRSFSRTSGKRQG